ncbi:MAG: hypothetical protein EOP53_17760 [Sphingobacteriales bacterium]|nr:MAG: hypothetical protein EOP53_17760 [Sphingobacteriales bacterium]
MRLFFAVCFFLLSFQFAFAQTDSAVTSGKKPWYLSLGADIKLRSIQGGYKYYYQGEFLEEGRQKATWLEKEEKLDDLLEFGSLYNLKMDVLLSRNKTSKIGLSYNFGVINYNAGNSAIYSTRNFYFIAITALGEQSWYFRKKKSELGDPFLFGSLAAGLYRGGDENSGPGNEYFSEARGGLGYHFSSDWMIRIFGAQNYMFYRERQTSPIFHKQQKVNVSMNLTYAGIGFIKQFTLIPD